MIEQGRTAAIDQARWLRGSFPGPRHLNVKLNDAPPVILMAKKRTKAEKWQRNVERFERRDEARCEIVDINEKRQDLAALFEEQIWQRTHQLKAETEIRAA